MIKNLKFNHLGLAVKDQSKAKELLYSLNYRLIDDVHDDNQNVRVALLKNDLQLDIEIISKININDETPIDKIINHNSFATYHICFEYENFDDLRKRKEESFLSKFLKKYIHPFLKKKFLFIYDSIGLIEIIHS